MFCRNEHTKVLPGSISISKSLPDVLNSLKAAPDRSDLYETAMELFNMSNDKGYKIFVNGKLAVPVRFVAEALGKQVSWTASGNIVIVAING